MKSVKARGRLGGIDLNLLVVLDAVLSELNVTSAARRIGLSQSATSHALSRLRDVFEDPLLVRTPRGMVATPFGRTLALPVKDILRRCEATLVSHSTFDPGTSRDVFRIAMEVSAQINLLPAVLRQTQKEAPQISVVARMLRPESLMRELEVGEVDFAVTAGALSTGAGIRNEFVMSIGHATLVRRNNPRVGRRLSLRSFLDLSHIAVDRPGAVDLDIDSLLAERSLARRVVATVETPVPIPALVAGSDLAATVPSMLLTKSDLSAMGIATFKPPLELPPVQVFLISHEYTLDSAAHRWMREIILAAFDSLA
jgi:DNA-binding transcriptional LysR family regulator